MKIKVIKKGGNGTKVDGVCPFVVDDIPEKSRS
jgi:hypothetical protein